MCEAKNALFTNFRWLSHREFIAKFTFITMRRSNLVHLILVTLTFHTFAADAFDAEDCPEICHCTMDGLLMLVDCSGLELTELPEFPDNQV